MFGMNQIRRSGSDQFALDRARALGYGSPSVQKTTQGGSKQMDVNGHIRSAIEAFDELRGHIINDLTEIAVKAMQSGDTDSVLCIMHNLIGPVATREQVVKAFAAAGIDVSRLPKRRPGSYMLRHTHGNAGSSDSSPAAREHQLAAART